MRLYRGLTKEGKWVYGWYVYRGCVPNDTHYIYNSGFYTEVISKTVGQQVGLKDKNGKEGYHHDLLNSTDRNISSSIEIIWKDGGWYGRYFGTTFTFPLNQREMDMSKIIGNVHQNPELLEK